MFDIYGYDTLLCIANDAQPEHPDDYPQGSSASSYGGNSNFWDSFKDKVLNNP